MDPISKRRLANCQSFMTQCKIDSVARRQLVCPPCTISLKPPVARISGDLIGIDLPQVQIPSGKDAQRRYPAPNECIAVACCTDTRRLPCVLPTRQCKCPLRFVPPLGKLSLHRIRKNCRSGSRRAEAERLLAKTAGGRSNQLAQRHDFAGLANWFIKKTTAPHAE